MTTLDWAAVGAHFALLLGLTWWSILRNRNTVDDYFLAGRPLGWVVAGASIFASNFASNIGSEPLVGLAGTAPPPERQFAGPTYATVSRAQRDASRRSWDWREVAGSAVVLVLIAVTYVYFNG